MPLKTFIAELKRRNLYVVAAAYVVIAWPLTQGASILFASFEAPTWIMKVFLVIILAGFFIALIRVWLSDKRVRWSWPRFTILIVSMVIVAGGLHWFQSMWAGADKSIAVLPFEDLGGCADSSFFAKGIHDDVLNNLAKIKHLKVISRTSVMFYREKGARTLREIGKDLEASHILEGTVRCVEDRVIVNVRLFRIPGEEPIWKDEYLRIQPNSLILQRDLASKIASELRIPLSRSEKAQLKAKTTQNQAAWVLYTQGRESQTLPESSEKNYLTAESFYKRAIGLDSDFVLARARLSFTQALLHQFFKPTNMALLKEARENAERALKQDANSAEAHLARARCAHLQKDEVLTKRHLSEAVRLLPNDATLRLAAAVTQQQLGWDKDATENYEHAVKLDPLAPRIRFNYGHHLYETGQEKDARWQMDSAIAREPKSIYFRVLRACAEISWSGDIGRARTILDEVLAEPDQDGQLASAYGTLAILERDFAKALDIVHRYPGEKLPAIDSGGLGGREPKVAAEGTIRLYVGERARAIECFESVRPSYEEAVRNDTESAIARAQLALLYAVMGEKEAAIAEAARAKEKNTPAAGPVKRGFILGLAKAYAWAGEPDLAWEQIEQFQDLPPSGYSKHNFRLEPAWDPIRNDPRFQELIR